MVTSLSKRAASSGEKIVLAISLTLHHLPRQPFGGKVHLFGDTVQFNRSIFLHVEGGMASFTILKRLVRKANPAAAYAESNFICADLDDCMVPAVKSMGSGVRAKQRCPGSPKFGVKLRVQDVSSGPPNSLFNQMLGASPINGLSYIKVFSNLPIQRLPPTM